ncbi:MAG: hypothetical protein ACR2PZ_14470 [Pseudomonadales bacterium]
MPDTSAQDWQARPEAGNTLGMRLLMWVAKRLGRRPLLLLLYPVTAYFYLSRAPERRASRAFLSRVFVRPARDSEVFKHFYSFARVTADRFFFLAGRAAEVPLEFVGGDEVQRVVDTGKAGIFLAAHLGSFEAARVVGPELGGIDLRIVLDQQQGGRFVDMMARINPEMVNKIIDSEQGNVALGLSIAQALRNHEWVGFLADRFRPGDRTTDCKFLGDSARFPLGPYLIANTFSAPVICAFCRLTEDGYEVHCEVLSDAVQVPRQNRAAALNALADRYVERLEHHVRATPYAWFNFFDFWKSAYD